ncbi:MAG: ribosome recycling factor [Gammaproteobacteria bacterium]|nr:ribosome recycling factor [Gammaproteobacteria bacterium]
MLDDIRSDAKERMGKSIESLEAAFARIRTGRAHPNILDEITVEYYGSATPMAQVANVKVEDARTLSIIPYEKSMVPVIEKAILKSDLGLTPATGSDKVRLPMPPLTEENRRDLTKHAKQEAEGARVAIRNIRRDANQMLKDMQKEKEITEDDARAGEEEIQKLTDEMIGKVDAMLDKKEHDLMEM